jgi:DNA replication licensing factor MCM6
MDAIIASDNIPSGTPTGSDPPPRQRDRASSRPSSRGLPSENGARSDADGFPDDQIVGSRGTVRRPRAPGGEIPKVVDEIGEHMVQQFEDFLET